MQLVVDSLMVSYQRLGRSDSKPDGRAVKPLMLVLHGWGDSSAGWLEFGQQFSSQKASQKDGYDVLIVDLPGFGGTQRPPGPWGLDEYAAFVGHVLQKLNVEPAVIFAHSNGGAIALRGMARGMFKAGKLVLLASAGVRSTYKGRKKALRLVTKTGKLLAAPLPDRVKDKLRRKLYTSVGSDMLVVEELQETFKRVVSDDVQQDAVQLDVPTLLIYGEDDVATPPGYGMLLHERIAGSTLEIIGGAGHFVHRDQPDKVRRLIEGFLS